MEIKKWERSVDIDHSLNEIKEFLYPYKELKREAFERLTSYVTALDKKAGIELDYENGYKIELTETDFFTELLPKAVADTLTSGKVSVKAERMAGSLIMELVDSKSGKVVGSDVHVRLMEQTVTEAGIYIQTVDRELEKDPDSMEKYKLADEAINNSEHLRAVTVAILFSKVIEQLLSEDTPVNLAEKQTKNFSPAWDQAHLPKLKR